MNTVWKDINQFEGLYQISNFGVVKSINRYLLSKNNQKRFYKGKKLKQGTDRYGYKYVVLNKKNVGFYRRVHRLVASSFLTKKTSLHNEVNHIDGNKLNNSITNLEWVTRIENIRHSIKIGIRNPHTYNKCNTGKGAR